MDRVNKTKKYKVKKSYLTHFLKEFWFIPPDVLQRGIEANVWDLCEFKKPILDVGIGNGRMSNFVFRNSPRIDIGIDSEESGLESARKTKKYRKVMHTNAENMPFDDASFNTVVSNSTFEHITDDAKAISEVARVLKKNGLFFITVPSEYLQKWILEFEEKENKIQAQKNLIKFNKRANHLHYRMLSEWKRNFNKNNLEIVFYRYYFPKKIAVFWYNLFKKFTQKLGKREVWSIMGNSKITKFIPKNMIINYLKNKTLKNAYENGFFVDSGVGAQLFMIVRKK